MLIGNIISVIDAYWYGRLSDISGYLSVNNGVILDKNKYYAAVMVECDSIKVRNILHDSIDESNIYYEDSNCADFEMFDSGILAKWIAANESSYRFYIVEYKPSISLNIYKTNMKNKIYKLQNKLNILDKITAK